jgi:hypothetical protein
MAADQVLPALVIFVVVGGALMLSFVRRRR